MDHNCLLSSYGDSYGVLELCIRDILSLIKPSENDQLKRLSTIDEIAILSRSVDSLKDAVIKPFGSFISNLYTKWGDLDTSVELSPSSPSYIGRKHKQNALRDIMKVLRKNGVASNFTFIPNARVPVLKFESKHHNVFCDISIDNHMGWLKSRVLLWISEIDERFRDMVLLTKEWAKAHNINDPTSGTLNSYSLCLLVIFHFQTCVPAILPPLKDIYEGNFVGITGTWSNIERQIENAFAVNVARFKIFRQRNPSTLCQLLISFFGKFSKLESLSSEYAICTYTGQWERITSNPRWMEKSHDLLVEDPFERPDNAARAVRTRELNTISDAFMTTYQKLSSYSSISDWNSLLDLLLRSNISFQLKVGTLQSHYTNHLSCEKPQIAFSGFAKRVDKQSQPSNSANVSRHENPQIAFSASAKRVDKLSRSSNSTIPYCEKPQIPYSVLRVDEQIQSSNSTNAGGEKPQIAFSGFAKRVDKQGQSSSSTFTGGEKPSKGVANKKNQSSNSTTATCEKPQIAFSGSAKRVDTHGQSSNYNGSSYGKPQIAFSGSANRVDKQKSHPSNSTIATGGNWPIAVDGSRTVHKGRNRSSTSTVAQPRQGYASVQWQQVWRPRNLNG